MLYECTCVVVDMTHVLILLAMVPRFYEIRKHVTNDAEQIEEEEGEDEDEVEVCYLLHNYFVAFVVFGNYMLL